MSTYSLSFCLLLYMFFYLLHMYIYTHTHILCNCTYISLSTVIVVRVQVRMNFENTLIFLSIFIWGTHFLPTLAPYSTTYILSLSSLPKAELTNYDIYS